MFDLAYAQSGPGAGGAGGGFSMMVPLILMFGVFYFLLIRPQQKKQRLHKEMLRALKVGDRVLTTGGLVGTIVEGGEQFIKLEVADKIRVEIGRSYIVGRIGSKESKEALPAAEGTEGSSAPGLGGLLGKLFGKK
ncbi:MAG: preprotein translocase subunit YajC [candidate division NC10 bacterium]|nr:preprotein translocase subunit YajC [candidate division NC10 bacterium]